MKISKKSWHMKFIKFIDSGYTSKVLHGEVSDCQYIRKLLGSFIVVAFVICVIFLILSIVFVGLVVFPVAYLFDIASWMPGKENIFGDYLPLVAICYSLIVMLLIAIVKLKYDEKAKGYPDNIFVAYLKSKKEKICSRVEFIEEERK